MNKGVRTPTTRDAENTRQCKVPPEVPPVERPGPGAASPRAQKLVSKSGGGAYTLFIFFCDTEESRPGVAPPLAKRIGPKSGGGAFKLFIFFGDTERPGPGVASPPLKS